MNRKHNITQKYIYLKKKAIYCLHYDDLIDRLLMVTDLEKGEINKFRNTIDYKLGAAILKPLRSLKWFFIKLFK